MFQSAKECFLTFSINLVFFLSFSHQLYAQELELAGHLSYAPLTLAGCWHYVDNNGGEWALVGTKAGMSIVDVNNPEQPVERFKVPGIQNNWREMTTWNGFAISAMAAMATAVPAAAPVRVRVVKRRTKARAT